MNSSPDEARLHDLFHRAVPDLGSLDPDEVRVANKTGTVRRSAAIVASVGVVAAALALSVALRHGSPTHRATVPVAPIGSVSSTNDSALDQYASEAPCTQDGNPLTLRPEGDQSAIEAFDAVAAVNCHIDHRDYPGDGQWEVLVRQVLPSDQLASLVAALTQPNQTRAADGSYVCGLIGYAPLPVLLVNAEGKYLHPQLPHDSCGAPLPGASNAEIGKLPWRTVSVTKIAQTGTQEAQASGCSMSWKNLFTFEANDAHRDTGSPVLSLTPNAPLTACVYKTGTDPEAGNFQRAVVLDDAQSQQLRAALDGAGPPASQTCEIQPSFAVVNAKGGGSVTVELGGCWRVLREDNNPATIGQGTADTVKELLKIS